MDDDEQLLHPLAVQLAREAEAYIGLMSGQGCPECHAVKGNPKCDACQQFRGKWET